MEYDQGYIVEVSYPNGRAGYVKIEDGWRYLVHDVNEATKWRTAREANEQGNSGNGTKGRVVQIVG